MHNPALGAGHCSCPDFITGKLNLCKHLIFLKKYLSAKKGFSTRVKKEVFPFADIYWDSKEDRPRLYIEEETIKNEETRTLLNENFDDTGFFNKSPDLFAPFAQKVFQDKKIVIQPEILNRLQRVYQNNQLNALEKETKYDFNAIKASLYDYQKEGIKFGLFKKSVLIGDEMGLGKTIQAITLSVLKKQVFDFKKVLIVTLASLKDQWQREIEKFTDESSVVVAGTPEQRKFIYQNKTDFFKITNYEAVLRDATIISSMKPDIIILDEAQRIKNFNTKTADAIKSLHRDHAIVLTGTPLENKLEDVYSIIQFLDPYLLSPLWDFAGRHFMISRTGNGKIVGYKQLNALKEKLSTIVIRRRKEEVLKDLPETVTNNYYIDLTKEQDKIHGGYASSLLRIINKKFLTPMDIRNIQMLLLKMRMVCNSTYLIDKKTNISPKLKEFQSIITDLVTENNRKVVVFSEWTTMTFLIAKLLSNEGIPFVELSGKVPVKKRQKLIDEFTNNPVCKIFLSTDSGGTGLNLQAADCVVNFELPWNPAKLNQRSGRVQRIGQKSTCINIINLIAKRSIEEKILSGIQMKTELFNGVFGDGDDFVDFSNDKKAGFINNLRKMMGEEQDEVPVVESGPQLEIPEDTPHYLNPSVLNESDAEVTRKTETVDRVNYSDEETLLLSDDLGESESTEPSESVSVFEGQPVEKIETVLNSGMDFIGGLLEMATGKKIEKNSAADKMLSIDKATGEVTMKFKLPGF
jgi:SNF2 family DNA or RNA helicase